MWCMYDRIDKEFTMICSNCGKEEITERLKEDCIIIQGEEFIRLEDVLEILYPPEIGTANV